MAQLVRQDADRVFRRAVEIGARNSDLPAFLLITAIGKADSRLVLDPHPDVHEAVSLSKRQLALALVQRLPLLRRYQLPELSP